MFASKRFIFLISLLIFLAFLLGVGYVYLTSGQKAREKKQIIVPRITSTAPTESGSLKESGITFHNVGSEAGLAIGDREAFRLIFTTLVQVFKPKGIEVFVYNKKYGGGNSVVFSDESGQFLNLKLSHNLSNFHVVRLALSASFPGFIEDSELIIGERNDGVTEIHMGIFVKENARPMPDDIRSFEHDVAGTLITTIVEKEEDQRNHNIIIVAHQNLNARYQQKELPMPIVFILNK